MPVASATEIPVIDVRDLVAGASDAVVARVAAEMRAACRGTGFFYVSNHGVAQEVVDAGFESNRRFHALPLDEKLKLKRNAWHRGYVAVGGNVARSSQRFASTSQPNQVESINIRHEVPADHPDYRKMPLQGPNEWPADPCFRESVQRYVDAVRDLGLRLLEPMSVAVGESRRHLAQYFDPPSTNMRLLHYPPGPAMRPEEVFGVHPHTDYGFLTILAQDGVGGLQVQRVDGSWIEAPSIPGTFVCNVGDMLARWTNEEFNSTPHRVIAPAASVDRYSIAYFFDPNLDARIACLPGFAGPDRPPKFEPVRYGDYYAMRLDANFQRAAVPSGAGAAAA
jgi:isopenicillin N synthase-like dioxygenase